MFGLFKKKPPKTSGHLSGSGGPVIAVLLLEGDSFRVDDFLKDVSRTRVGGQSVTKVDHGDGDVFSFYVGDELLALAHMRAPYPAADLEGPIATSWMWPPEPSIDTLKTHRSFLLITMTGGHADPVHRRLILTAVTALAARQPGVMAVFWAEAALVIYPPVFIAMAETINTPQAPPLSLWVDLRAFRNPDGTTGLFTAGLSALGHMEIEIDHIHMDPGELREWLLNIMYYLLENGPILKDGQTIGMTAEQQIRIRHCPSSYGHPGTVIRLEP